MTEQGNEALPEHGRSATRIRKVEFAGIGNLVQFLGLLGAIASTYFGYALGSAGTGLVIGLVGCVCLFVVGSEMSKKYVCGSCGNPLASKHVRICPTCKAQIE
jgi:hypothetical protein